MDTDTLDQVDLATAALVTCEECGDQPAVWRLVAHQVSCSDKCCKTIDLVCDDCYKFLRKYLTTWPSVSCNFCDHELIIKRVDKL